MSSSTLVDFWTSEQSIYEGSPKGSLNGLRPRAEQAIAKARAAIETARALKQKAANDAAAAQQEIAALRARMTTDGPADAAVDAIKLRRWLAEMHTAAGRIASFGDMILKIEADLARATAERDRFVARAAAAAAALAAAQERERTRVSWLDRNDATKLLPSLMAVPVNASSKSAAATAAEKTIDAYFPAGSKIRDAVTERWELEKKLLDKLAMAARDADTELLKQLQAPGSGLGGKVESARRVYDHAWDALASFVRTAEEEFHRAIGLYAVVTSLPLPPGSLVASLAAGTFHDDAVALLPTETERNNAFDEFIDALAALATAVLQAGALDPVPLDPNVVTKFQALKVKEGLTLEKQKLLRPAGPNAIDLWEAAAPDEAFQGLAALKEATDILTRLAAISPGTLLGDLTSAEKNLVIALTNATSADRVTAFLQDTVAQRHDWLERANTVRLDHLFSAARGDV